MKIEISVGELVDKVSILEIKLEKITNKEKLSNVKKEFNLLNEAMNSLGIDASDSNYRDLKNVNLALWDIEDKIRIKEKNKNFDEEFVQLARSVYFENDKRAEIKKRINLETGSDLVEEKEYTDYK